MDILTPNFIKYQLYLLQLENYELLRYWKLLFGKGFFPSQRRPLRKELVWTVKAKALLLMAVAMHVLAVIGAGLITIALQRSVDGLLGVLLLVFLLGLPFYFLWLSLALLLIWPLDNYVKKRLVGQARLKLVKLGGLRIIGVAGSYGKTTMKEVLQKVLSTKYKVLSTPESVNTPVGIARFVLNKVDEQCQVLILELGEHYRGDIKALCQIAPLDVSVITGINEAHLERLGSLDNVVATIFEAAEFGKNDALVVLNADDKLVAANYKKFIKPTQRMEKYQISDIQDSKFSAAGLGWTGKVNGVEVEIRLLGEYALADASAAVTVGKHLGLSDQEICMGLLAVRPVEHRLQPMPSAANVLVIDDSYNGNPAGAAEAVKVLERFLGRRKIYLTPGLVETGTAAPAVHREIGRRLAGVADVVILIKNSVAGYIEEGIKQQAIGNRPQIIWFAGAPAAHEGLKDIVKSGDVVLLQNDWGDQYL